MDDLTGLFTFFIIMAVVVGAIRVFLMFRAAVTFSRFLGQALSSSAQQNFYANPLNQGFNNEILGQFMQLALALQQHQAAAAAQARAEAERLIAQLPTRQRPVHESRLRDIVSEGITLNRVTGEWE